MTASFWIPPAAFLAAIFVGGLACWLFARRGEAPFYLSLAVLSGLVSLVHLAGGLGLTDKLHGLLWHRLMLAGELCLPAVLLHTGLRFFPSIQQKESVARLWSVRVIGLLGVGLAALAMTNWVLISVPAEESGRSDIVVTPWGHVTYIFIVVATALGLAQLEVVLRSSRELTRYRLKLILIGLGGLGGYQIYHASEMLMVSVWREEHVLAFGVVSIMSWGLLTLGIARSRFKELLFNTQVSQQALVGSVTFIAVGLYLLLVGAIGAWLRRIDQPLGYELGVVVVLGALAALVTLATSKTTRSEIKRFLARNFSRSKYDYRAEWLCVTRSFQGATTREAIVECLHDLLVKTFATTTIAVWILREADQRYHQARPADPTMPTMEATHPVIQKLMSQDDPVMLEERSGDRFEASDPFIRLKARLCSPIYVQDRLAAFVMLGTQPRGDRYGVDDCDLLRGICHHAGVLFAHADLAEERQASAELEALHRFSVFCLHDIKNLAARLSLVAQNAERHGHDPAFQQSAFRTVADTARKMTDLISKLSRQAASPSVKDQAGVIDLAALLDEAVAPLRSDQRIALHVEGDLDVPIRGVREQIQQVLTNVALNARQAITDRGSISIVVVRSKDSAIITIDDTGRGVPATMLDRLFRPSQSSRPGGLGVGLYQCKRIIEAHGGTITLCSEEGKGTRVRIELPLADSLHKAGVGRP